MATTIALTVRVLDLNQYSTQEDYSCIIVRWQEGLCGIPLDTSSHTRSEKKSVNLYGETGNTTNPISRTRPLRGGRRHRVNRMPLLYL